MKILIQPPSIALAGHLGTSTHLSDNPCRLNRSTQHPLISASDRTFQKRLIFWAVLNWI